MRARLVSVITALAETIERLDGVADDETIADAADLLSESTDRVAECETLLRIGGLTLRARGSASWPHHSAG